MQDWGRDVDWFYEIETVMGSPYGDYIEGSSWEDSIYGLGGPDRIVGRAGSDVLLGGRGKDLFRSRDSTYDLVRGGRKVDQAYKDQSDRLISSKAVPFIPFPLFRP
jgi:hypothetical protein